MTFYGGIIRIRLSGSYTHHHHQSIKNFLAVGVGVAVCFNPLAYIFPVSFEVVAVSIGDHVQGGVAAALGLPQIMAPVIIGVALQMES